jgi:hypothetical protein
MMVMRSPPLSIGGHDWAFASAWRPDHPRSLRRHGRRTLEMTVRSAASAVKSGRYVPQPSSSATETKRATPPGRPTSLTPYPAVGSKSNTNVSQETPFEPA